MGRARVLFDFHRTLIFFISVSIICNVPSTQADITDCLFVDTVELSENQKLPNGSYHYQGVMIPPDLIGDYSYLEDGHGEITNVPTHKRGCVCKVKSCVRYCCNPRSYKKHYSNECLPLDEKNEYSEFVNVTLNNGTSAEVSLAKEFVAQVSIACTDGYAHNVTAEDKWKLFENGTLLLVGFNDYVPKEQYCLTPLANFSESGEIELTPILCPVIEKEKVWFTINKILMTISIPFLILTAIVYMIIPQLFNLHGKCLVSYLLALTMAFMSYMPMKWKWDMTDSECLAIGTIAYYTMMAAFFWVSVISYDLWANFRKLDGKAYGMRPKNTFLIYSFIAWGMAALMTFIEMMAQHVMPIHESWKPNLGSIENCWFSMEEWLAVIYFYGPLFVLVLFNLTMFILTAVHIWHLKREMGRMMSQNGDKNRSFHKQRETYEVFLRLFIVMGITWLLEVISYLYGPDKPYAELVSMGDILNSSQGIIIFVLFVMKPKVITLLKNRLYNRKDKHARTSIATTTSRVSKCSNNHRLTSFRSNEE